LKQEQANRANMAQNEPRLSNIWKTCEFSLYAQLR